MPLAHLKSQSIEEWLSKFSSPNSRQTWLNRISTLFSFAKRHGWIEKNPCDLIERIRIDRAAPRILTPKEARLVLAAAPPLCRPYVILGMYAGIRPEELMHVEWSNICLETASVAVERTKTRRRRIVPQEPLAVKLLGDHPFKQGRIAPSSSTVRRFKRRARSFLREWPADLLRHTAASYLLALHGDAGKVAMMLGNSSKILLTHYHTPVTKDACAEFWRMPV